MTGRACPSSAEALTAICRYVAVLCSRTVVQPCCAVLLFLAIQTVNRLSNAQRSCSPVDQQHLLMGDTAFLYVACMSGGSIRLDRGTPHLSLSSCLLPNVLMRVASVCLQLGLM